MRAEGNDSVSRWALLVPGLKALSTLWTASKIRLYSLSANKAEKYALN